MVEGHDTEEQDEWTSGPIRLEMNHRFPTGPWDRLDLSAAFAGFSDGSPLLWLGAARLAAPGAPAPATVEGADWKIAVLSKSFEAPGFDSNGERQDLTIEPPVAVISVPTGQVKVEGARDIGRPRLRAVIGYAHLRSPLLTGAALVWEGPGYLTGKGGLALGTGATQTILRISAEGLDEIRRSLLGLRVGELETRQLLALEWFAEAWRSDTTAIRFANLWFAVVVLVDSTFSAKERKRVPQQLERIRLYLLVLPISKGRRLELYSTFASAYQLRNRLVHEGDSAGITPDAFSALGDATSQLLLTDLGRTRA